MLFLGRYLCLGFRNYYFPNTVTIKSDNVVTLSNERFPGALSKSDTGVTDSTYI